MEYANTYLFIIIYTFTHTFHNKIDLHIFNIILEWYSILQCLAYSDTLYDLEKSRATNNEDKEG